MPKIIIMVNTMYVLYMVYWAMSQHHAKGYVPKWGVFRRLTVLFFLDLFMGAYWIQTVMEMVKHG